jgi:hypothetical protein
MALRTNLTVGIVVASAMACTNDHRTPPSVGAAPTVAAAVSTGASAASAPLPDYLVRLAQSGDLYARDGGAIVSAPEADMAVLRGYPSWTDKGPLTGAGGERLTILSAKSTYAAGEEVRVIHVHEATKAGVELYVMGPKAIFGEYVDGVLASAAASAPVQGYDGRVVPSPGADHNYEVSRHRLARGVHTIEWRFATLSGPTVLRSNVLRIEVR